jgi:LPS export ABC transporter ATP-binding protein
MMFVAPDSFPFSQSILFLLAVIVGGAGWVLGPLVGAIVTVLLPEFLSGLAEYRLLAMGALLLVVLWLAPDGIIGTLARPLRWRDPAIAPTGEDGVAEFLAGEGRTLEVSGIGIAFGGIRAATDVSFSAPPGRITSVIGPNGAGKTTVLNMIGGFYRPDAGRIRLGAQELAGAPAWAISRAGIARTYQTTQLFGEMSVIDNVLVALRRGHLGNPVGAAAHAPDRALAEALLCFVGYRGALAATAKALPHVDRRLVEIARALATRPNYMLLDEPFAGIDPIAVGDIQDLVRHLTNRGIGVLITDHNVRETLGLTDRAYIVYAGEILTEGSPEEIVNDPDVRRLYLGEEFRL